jgi:hypothetical protein
MRRDLPIVVAASMLFAGNVGTRTVEVALTMLRQAGSYNDGYADNVSLSFTPVADR